MNPHVSVVMPLYNSEEHLKEAIDSILNQTYTDFEFIIVNDACTDTSMSIVESYDDDRIVVLHNETNIGSAGSMNKGIRAAKGDLIARMDSDDISLSHRLDSQVAFMNAHTDISICGASVKVIGDIEEYVWKYESDPEELKARLLFDCRLAFPTAMMRKSIFEEYDLWFDETFRRAEDFDVWARASHRVGMSNIKEVLLHYRVGKQNTSHKFVDQYKKWIHSIHTQQLHHLDIEPTEQELSLHMDISQIGSLKTEELIFQASKWMENILQKNQKKNIYKQTALQKICAHFWYGILIRNFSLKNIRNIHSDSSLSQLFNMRQKVLFTTKYFFSKLGLV